MVLFSVPQAYHDPMLKLSIMSEEELTHIFGNLDAYIPLHEDLLARLSKATGADGTVGQIGQIIVSWVSGPPFSCDGAESTLEFPPLTFRPKKQQQ